MPEAPAKGIEVVTFGCRLNTYESEVMRREAESAGLGALKGGAIIFNTCAVTGEAVRQAKQSIRKARRENPEARIIVTGCAAQTKPQDFSTMGEVDLVLGNEEKLKAHNYRALPDFGVNDFEKARVNDIMSVKETASHMVDAIEGRARAFVQVQNGCDHRCTFCIIPYGRGNSRSVPMGAVIEQIKRLAGNGYAEIVLSGVDMTSYGADLPGAPRLGRLVKTILRQVPEVRRLRLSSIDSIEADDDLLEAIATESRLMPHLHLSLQSGDDMILKRMKRRHLRDQSIRFCEDVRKLRPGIVFGADIIAGFPTETDAMFDNSVAIVEECGLTHLHVFPFSPREGTPAARMPQVRRDVVKSRAARLRAAGDAAYARHLASLGGTTQSILIERAGLGRTEGFTLAAIAAGQPGEIIEAVVTGHDGARLEAAPLTARAAWKRAGRMAFGFIKKVFSFGKKEVVEEKVDETAPLPPLNFDALEALRPAAEQEVPDFLKREEQAEAIPAPEPAAPEKIEPAAPEAKAADEEPIEIAEQEVPDFLKREEQAETVPASEPVTPEPEKVEPAGPEAEAPDQELIETAAEPEALTARVEQPAFVETAPEPVTEEPEEAPVAQIDVEQAEAVVEPEPVAPVVEPVEPKPVAEVEATPAPEADTAAESPPAMPEPEVEHSELESQPETPQAEEEPAMAVEPTIVVEEVPQAETETASEIVVPEPEPEPVALEPVEAPQVEATVPPTPVAEPAAARATAGKVTVSKKVEQKTEPEKAPEPVAKRSWFQRMREGLARSSRELSGNIAGVFTKRKLDEETLQDLEDVLIRADLGVETALRVTDSLASSRYGKDVSDTEVRAVMAAEVEKVLGPVAKPLELDLSHKPHVILVVGVNGTGKTTTIGKLAAKLTDGGLSVMLAAGDTFRAAAIEQLKIWGERTKSPVIATKLGADAAGLAYDAFEKAREAGSDVLIIDTAGRLQNKAELMAELEKIVRVLGKLDPEAPHTVLQTVDATTGQNALNQVEIFRNIAGVNGLVMTKLDGTARGGILVAIAAKHKLPVYFIGVGEQVDDLEPFSASDFARAIAGVG